MNDFLKVNQEKTLQSKGYSRLYVHDKKDIKAVLDIIKSIDKFEYEYTPKKWVTHINEYPNVVFTGKFDDLDLNVLTCLCVKRGIPIFIFDAHGEDSPMDMVKNKQ